MSTVAALLGLLLVVVVVVALVGALTAIALVLLARAFRTKPSTSAIGRPHRWTDDDEIAARHHH